MGLGLLCRLLRLGDVRTTIRTDVDAMACCQRSDVLAHRQGRALVAVVSPSMCEVEVQAQWVEWVWVREDK